MQKILLIIISLILILSGFPANAAVKAGANCTPIGTKKISGDKEFTCVKSGSKLIWNKGVKIKASPVLSFKTMQSPKKITFSNLGKNYAYVPITAWANSGQKIANTKPANVKITLLVGPNTDPINKNPIEAVTLASKMYGDFDQAKEFVLIYFSIYDVPWAEKLVEEYIGKNGGYDVSGEVKKLCPSRNSCNSAAALSNSVTGIGLTIVTASDQMRTDPVFYSGTLEAHEYSHTIQKKQYFGRIPQGLAPPQWLTEGGAEFIQTASVHSTSFDNYLIDRKRITADLYNFKSFDSKWLNSFLNPNELGTDWNLWKKYDGFRVYDVGFMISEIFVAIQGPNSIMDIFKYMGDGLTFQDSFFKVFNVKWDLAIETITKVLAEQIG